MAKKANPLAAKNYLMGKIDEFVKQAGRDTMLYNVERDPYDVGYARIPDGEACDFCRMLGSRGFVYKSEESAGGGSLHGTKMDKYHPWCNCQIAVSFDRAVLRYWKNWTTVTRAYGDDASVVAAGRDGLKVLRGYDPDTLYDEYIAAGKSYASKSRIRGKGYSTRHDLSGGSKLPENKFNEAKNRLAAAESLDELKEVADDVVRKWKPNAYGRNVDQFESLRGYVQELKRAISSKEGMSSPYVGLELFDRASGFKEAVIGEVEVSQAFDINNRPIGKLVIGTAHSVLFSKPVGYEWKDVRIAHTHPSGVTFSTLFIDETGNKSGDVFFLTDSGAISIDAVSDEFVFTLVRTKNANPEAFLDAAMQEEARIQSKVLGDFVDAFYEEHGYPPSEVDLKEGANERLREVSNGMDSWYNEHASDYGYEYYKRKRS